MKIVEMNPNGNGKTSGGKKELGAAEKWLFDTESGEVRLKALMNMSAGQQGIADLSEFKTYGSDAEKSYGLDIALNRVFILGNIPLIARGREDRVVIKKVETFDLEIYNKADKKEMGANHIETVKAKLAEALA
ncbi:MAG: hypothetical protein J5U19_11485 [Candidatus Methanoperedens sp.]|nr:hypothetical protein [Candidatus Methanoperedens sp.]